jgi:multiple antibiotic resistance protein
VSYPLKEFSVTEKLIRDALVLWATVDPIGTMAVFAALTRGFDARARAKTAVKATLYATAVLIGSIVVGQVALAAMGIRLISVQVAGGVILFIFGLQMVFGTGAASDTPSKEPGHDIAVFPLAVPSIATPGAILAAILLTDNHLYGIPTQLATTGVLIAVLAVTLAMMLGATLILRVVGNNGASILVRVMGLVLAAMSVEFIMEALRVPQWLEQLP